PRPAPVPDAAAARAARTAGGRMFPQPLRGTTITMSYDPYGDEFQQRPGGPRPPGGEPDFDRERDRPPPKNAAGAGRVTGPAVLLIIVGVLNFVAALGGGGCGAMFSAVPTSEVEKQMKKDNPKQLDDLKKA